MKHTEYPYQEKSYEDKSPAEIEAEIEQTRADMNNTLHALERRFSPGQLMDQTLSYFRGAGEETNEFATNLGRNIKDNPIPVALLGIGLGWLMMGGSERSDHRYSRIYRHSTDRPARRPIVTPSGEPATATATSQSAGSYRDQARQTAHEARERAGGMAHAAKEKISETAQRTREQTKHAADEAREKMGDVTEAARYQAQRAKRGFTYLLQEHPLVLGSIGIALGAALGAGLPPTRKEDEWMGRERDELLARAEATGREQLHKVEQVAETAQAAAREEAKRQNLTPEAGKEELEKVKHKAERVAEAARGAAKKEVKRQDLGSSPHSQS
ncbi:DUF3618 domain-containing protein [Nitrosococcus oceani]|uniref:DUF3618 domain-containing protein n=2 Tax=Nitrosococcus oceani TaxID=1229 RepID=Q3JAS5_NITOC|nr:DUF3618 domain-containing protein [Nitrosococcus oceani]ABA58071.1 hypothetical protein Noc_1592 [Nitrosococcus oceani ATCC 19707]EDZ67499.1 hypothetical protein NOC27_826 [Nitrosococcus oceani AFC27]KFI19490.1 hypothetical protein IB75_08425 [Nitrosococcus oceani C-27]KFI22733.1 hypothetical protein HW44_07620 [Nitrosococcus oceani]